MVKYICNRCGYLCNQKTDLKRHLLRKKPCIPIINSTIIGLNLEEKLLHNPDITHYNPVHNPDITRYNPMRQPDVNLKNIDEDDDLNSCKYCHKIFKHYQHRWRHEKLRCKLRNNNASITNMTDNSNNSHNNTTNNSHNTTNNNTTNTTNNTVIINNFGEEDISHIKPINVKKLISSRPYAAIQSILEEVYSKPENKNIKLLSLHGKDATIKRNGKYEVVSLDEALNEAGNMGIKTIKKKAAEMDLDLDHKNYDKYNDVEEDFVNENNATHTRICEDIKHILQTEHINTP